MGCTRSQETEMTSSGIKNVMPFQIISLLRVWCSPEGRECTDQERDYGASPAQV